MIPRLLNNDGDGIVKVLVRAGSDEEAAARIDETLGYLFKPANLHLARRRVSALRGDITSERLGLSARDFDALAGEVTHIIHSAATTRFDLPLKEATAINLGGTLQMLELAKRAASARLERYAHVSTAYVSGDRNGRIFEEDLWRGQGFINSYEQTKFESERKVRECMGEIPALVLRPCAVIGDSGSGRTRTFNVIYYPLRLLSRGLLRVLPGSPRTPIDLVPVDYVVDAINHIMLRGDSSGKTYHLTAGKDAATIGTIARLAVQFLNESRRSGDPPVPPVRFIPHWVFQAFIKPTIRMMYGARGRAVMEKLEVYLPYLTRQKNFDTSNAIAALRGTGIAPPPLESYFKRVVRYCRETDWGRVAKDVPAGEEEGASISEAGAD